MRAGPAPKDASLRRRTNSPDEWLDVPNVPYTGPSPDLPDTRWAGNHQVSLLPATYEWWETIRSMPHAALWDRAEWQFALDTAILADMLYRGNPSVGAQLSTRMRHMGATADSRRAMRIRYVDPDTGEEVRTTGTPTGRKAPHARSTKRNSDVLQIDDYRDL